MGRIHDHPQFVGLTMSRSAPVYVGLPSGIEQIDVIDDGMGISLAEQERIFERFFRGEQSLILGISGTGLGLSIVLNLVEMHGGRIWVNSDGIPGKGSTFTVSMPAATTEDDPSGSVN